LRHSVPTGTSGCSRSRRPFPDVPVAGASDQSPLPDSLASLNAEVVQCFRCPRLVSWREQVADEKRAAYRDWDYWGRPLPSFGDPHADLLVVGLAPAAHGGNRTGRFFTGDRSGDWLFGALHRAGYANQPQSQSRADGLWLVGAYIAACVRCAPPANRPLPSERDACLPYLRRELQLLTELRTIICLGAYAYDGVSRLLGLRGRPAFGHGVEAPASDELQLICSYHPSQQNTFTGKLTVPMFDAVFARARQRALLQ
jgi:uracil-DNA glycosylase family 4